MVGNDDIPGRLLRFYTAQLAAEFDANILGVEICPTFSEHDFVDEYHGTRCTKCHTFFAYGSAPWDEDAIDAI